MTVTVCLLSRRPYPLWSKSLAMLLPATQERDFHGWGSLAVRQIYVLSMHLCPAHHPQGAGNEGVIRMCRCPGLLAWVPENFIALLESLIVFCLHERGRLVSWHARLSLSLSHFLITVHLAGLLYGLGEVKRLESSELSGPKEGCN